MWERCWIARAFTRSGGPRSRAPATSRFVPICPTTGGVARVTRPRKSRPEARFQRQACSAVWCRPRRCRGLESAVCAVDRAAKMVAMGSCRRLRRRSLPSWAQRLTVLGDTWRSSATCAVRRYLGSVDVGTVRSFWPSVPQMGDDPTLIGNEHHPAFYTQRGPAGMTACERLDNDARWLLRRLKVHHRAGQGARHTIDGLDP